MDDKKFIEIKREYDEFYNSLLKKGKLPMFSTKLGFWNASISDEIYEAFKKIRLKNYSNFLDLGSGDGKIVLIASLFCKNCAGIEIDPFLHKKAIGAAKKLKINANFYNNDFFESKISKYDSIFLSPDAPFTRGMEKKLLSEMKGKLILYGNHFEPMNLKKEKSFVVNKTNISVYSNERS